MKNAHKVGKDQKKHFLLLEKRQQGCKARWRGNLNRLSSREESEHPGLRCHAWTPCSSVPSSFCAEAKLCVICSVLSCGPPVLRTPCGSHPWALFTIQGLPAEGWGHSKTKTKRRCQEAPRPDRRSLCHSLLSLQPRITPRCTHSNTPVS